MNPYLIPALELSPAIFRRLFSKIGSDQLDLGWDGRFSPREIIAHMADWEPILLARIHQSINDPGSTLQAYDESQLAREHDYATSKANEQLQLFADRRKATVDFLKSLQDEDWEKSGVHSERGKLSVREQATTLLGHDVYHIEQISAYL